MAHSSPEGIELGKGSQLVSLDLSINQEKVLVIKQQERMHSSEEVGELISLLKSTTEYEVLESFRNKVSKFEQFKK